jgi:hypothetical protein
LQQFLWILKNIAELVALRAQHFGSQVRGNLDSRHRSVFGNEANLVDLDARIAGQRNL